MSEKQPYLVTREEIWTQAIRVQAESAEKAILEARAGKGEFLRFKFDRLGKFYASPIGGRDES